MTDFNKRALVYAAFSAIWGVSLGWWGVLAAVVVIGFMEWRISNPRMEWRVSIPQKVRAVAMPALSYLLRLVIYAGVGALLAIGLGWPAIPLAAIAAVGYEYLLRRQPKDAGQGQQ